MGVEKNSEGPSNRLNKSNSVDVYVPPALRRSVDSGTQHQSDVNNSSKHSKVNATSNQIKDKEAGDSQQGATSTVTRIRRERRPDRAVYIPRARRSLTTPPQVATSQPVQTSATPLNISQSNKSNSNSKQLNHNQKRNKEKEFTGINKDGNGLTGDYTAVILNCDTGKENDHRTTVQKNSGSILNTTATPTNTTTITTTTTTATTISTTPDFKLEPGCDKVHKDFKSFDSTNIENAVIINHSTNMTENKPPNTALRIEDAADSSKTLKGDNEHEEFQRASKEINRSNRRIIKQTFNSDILEIPEKIVGKDVEYNKTQGGDELKSKEVDPEIDDWDTMFDDNGECIDPKILEELNASVGKVKIETPKTDYTAYHLKRSILNEEEFPHVLEVSNFPVEFKTQDLMMIFSTYKESGFDIKWVDDTHALAVFSSSRVAAEVLAMGHPFVLLKPLTEATIESRTKAKKCSSSLQPYRPRPETCAALARRLVTGALGVRLKTAAEERENEKRVLKEAKERKLLAAKQRDEAWES